MDDYADLALLTDGQVDRCLNHVISAYAATKGYDFKKFIAQPDQMIEAVKSVAAEVSVPLAGAGDVTAQNRPEAARVLLVEMAGIPELQSQIASWLQSDRKTLLEPITTALILAGLVTILSTEVDLEYKQENDKRKIGVKVKKPSAPKEILRKTASFF